MHTIPTAIDPDYIKAEAQKAAWLYSTLDEACPYPWGTEAANAFTRAFDIAKETMAANFAPPPKVAAPNTNKLSGKYTPARDAYYRNNGNPHIPSAGLPC